ncbi:MAG: hypothetical protein DWQ02_19560, partial [Bacteroidetes bacterium]
MRFFIVLSLFSFMTLSMSLVTNDQMPDFQKKIHKMAGKQWKDLTFKIKKPALPEQIERTLTGRQVYTVTSPDSLLGIMMINKALGCHIGGCDTPGNSSGDMLDSSFEKFYYAVIFDTNLVIRRIKVLQYESDFGYEICGKRWLRQFVGYKGCELEFNHHIDGISGATVSAQSITSDINNL